jgi:hypothetical protein
MKSDGSFKGATCELRLSSHSIIQTVSLLQDLDGCYPLQLIMNGVLL